MELNHDRGSFIFERRPKLFFLACPELYWQQLEQNKYCALWKLALNAALYIARSRRLRWETLRERRDRRRAYITLLRERDNNGGALVEWSQIVNHTDPEDLKLWHLVAYLSSSCESQLTHTFVHLFSLMYTPLNVIFSEGGLVIAAKNPYLD